MQALYLPPLTPHSSAPSLLPTEDIPRVLAAAGTTVSVDCEGQNLGCIGGRVTLVALYSESMGTLLIDVCHGYDNACGLKELLMNVRICKVFFDCRSDCVCFREDLGIPYVDNFIDLQLLDILVRKETETTRCHNRRLQYGVLYQYLHHDASASKQFVSMLYRLNSLGKAIEESGASGAAKKADIDHKQWGQRPLTKDQTLYAMNDVWLIDSLYKHFHQRGSLTRYKETLLEATKQYCKSRPHSIPINSTFLRHCLLPMGILFVCDDGSGSEFICTGCRRALLRACECPMKKGIGYCASCYAQKLEQERIAIRNAPREPQQQKRKRESLMKQPARTDGGQQGHCPNWDGEIGEGCACVWECDCAAAVPVTTSGAMHKHPSSRRKILTSFMSL